MTPFNYLRAESEEQALKLIRKALPLGGGTWLAANRDRIEAILDLNRLELDRLSEKKGRVSIGASVPLQRLLEFTHLEVLQRVLKLELGWNMRNQATVTGVLVASSARSPLSLAMLALDAQLKLAAEKTAISVDRFLDLRKRAEPTQLVTEIEFRSPAVMTYHQVARAPRDRPLVSVSVVKNQGGGMQIGLGGYGERPIRLVEAERAIESGAGIESAAEWARTAFREADDGWASGAYRSDVAAALLRRALQEVR